MDEVKPNNISISQMFLKLDDMFMKEQEIIKQMNLLKRQYSQILEDIQMLENLIMYASNRTARSQEQCYKKF